MTNEELFFRGIKKLLLNICDSRKESIRDIAKYYNDFPNEIDYNIVTYGNLSAYKIEIIELYKNYKKKLIKEWITDESPDRLWDNDELWNNLKFAVGWVVDTMILKKK